MSDNEALYHQIVELIQKLASDPSVPDYQTTANLEALLDEITDLLQSQELDKDIP